EQGRPGRALGRGRAAAAAPASTARRAIQQLVAVGADVVLGDARDEVGLAAIAQAIAMQRAAAAAPSAATAPAGARRLEVVDDARSAGTQLRVLVLGHTGHR